MPSITLPNGPLPAIPPGGIPATPVAMPPALPLPLPVNTVPNQPVSIGSLNLPSLNGQQFVATATGTNMQSPALPSSNGGQPWQGVAPPEQSGQRIQGFLDELLNSGNPYLVNAGRRGLETAGQRGLSNSSIAAGASTRSAIEAAQPILNNIAQLNSEREGMNFSGSQNDANRQTQVLLDREGRAFQGEQAGLDRTQGVNNALLGASLDQQKMATGNYYDQSNALLGSQLQRNTAAQDFEFRKSLQADSVAQQDWLANNSFSREFNAALSLVPIQNASQLQNYMMQAAINQPEVFTPTVMSGMQNFFNNNFLALMQSYFPEGAS